MANENKQQSLKNDNKKKFVLEIRKFSKRYYTDSEKVAITNSFRSLLDQKYSSTKQIGDLKFLVESQIQEKGFIDFNLASVITPRLIGESLLSLNKKAAPGLDTRFVYDLMQNGINFCEELSNEIQNYQYIPGPYTIREIQKDSSDPSNVRKIGVFQNKDKVIQKLLYCILETIYDVLFIDASFAYRPSRSPQKASKFLQEALKNCDKEYAVVIDIKKYFDSIPHQPLITILKEKVRSQDILIYIEDFLKSTRIHNQERIQNSIGTPQGSLLGAILSNIYLHYVLDIPLTEQFSNIAYCRYADDFLVFTKTRKEAIEILSFIAKQFSMYGLFISEKTGNNICHTSKGEIPFIGYLIIYNEGKYQILPSKYKIEKQKDKFMNSISIHENENLLFSDFRGIKDQLHRKIKRGTIFQKIEGYRDSLRHYESELNGLELLVQSNKELITELKDLLFIHGDDNGTIRRVVSYARKILVKQIELLINEKEVLEVITV
ncbi:reverse transcriptase domain-containing protein [Leptospira sp. WS92.C1]